MLFGYHEGQVQQLQVELRQLQQALIIKQDELTRLNRDNERLLSDSRQQAKVLASDHYSLQRPGAETRGPASVNAFNRYACQGKAS
jgi:hypothetical protein